MAADELLGAEQELDEKRQKREEMAKQLEERNPGEQGDPSAEG